MFPQVLPKVLTFQPELFDSVIENEGLYVLEPTTSLYAATPTGSPIFWGTRLLDRLSREFVPPVVVAPERYIASGEEDLQGRPRHRGSLRPYLPEAVFRKLRAWNAAGGTLITSGTVRHARRFWKRESRLHARRKFAAHRGTCGLQMRNRRRWRQNQPYAQPSAYARLQSMEIRSSGWCAMFPTPGIC